MAARQHWLHRRGSSAVTAALATLFMSPASAAPPHIICSESEAPDLHVAVEELAARSVAHDRATDTLSATQDDDHSAAELDDDALLAPLAREAIRHVFNSRAADDDDGVAIEEEPVETPRAMNTRLPGVSDERLQRYKKQMFRRDI